MLDLRLEPAEVALLPAQAVSPCRFFSLSIIHYLPAKAVSPCGLMIIANATHIQEVMAFSMDQG